MHDFHTRIFYRKFFGNLHTSITPTIIYANNLNIFITLIRCALYCSGYELLDIIHWDNYGEFGLHWDCPLNLKLQSRNSSIIYYDLSLNTFSHICITTSLLNFSLTTLFAFVPKLKRKFSSRIKSISLSA